VVVVASVEVVVDREVVELTGKVVSIVDAGAPVNELEPPDPAQPTSRRNRKTDLLMIKEGYLAAGWKGLIALCF
jgi:hypothetical protein